MLPIISAEERLKERHSAKIALVGQPGVGKTSQLRTLPADSTLFVDLEAGDLQLVLGRAQRLRHRPSQRHRAGHQPWHQGVLARSLAGAWRLAVRLTSGSSPRSWSSARAAPSWRPIRTPHSPRTT